MGADLGPAAAKALVWAMPLGFTLPARGAGCALSFLSFFIKGRLDSLFRSGWWTTLVVYSGPRRWAMSGGQGAGGSHLARWWRSVGAVSEVKLT